MSRWRLEKLVGMNRPLLILPWSFPDFVSFSMSTFSLFSSTRYFLLKSEIAVGRVTARINPLILQACLSVKVCVCMRFPWTTHPAGIIYIRSLIALLRNSKESPYFCVRSAMASSPCSVRVSAISLTTSSQWAGVTNAPLTIAVKPAEQI